MTGDNIDTGSLLMARGFNGGGYGGGLFGGGGYGGGGMGSFASPSANAVRINEGAKASATGIENLLDQNQFAATNQSITGSCNRVTDKLDVQSGRQADLTTNSEFRNGDRLRDLERVMIAGQKEAAACCCAATLEACKNTNVLLAAIADSKATALAIEGRGVERTLNATQAELISLKTQVACHCNCPS